MVDTSDESMALAGVALGLYSTLAGVSCYYFLKFRSIVSDNPSHSRLGTIGRYDEPKVLFFFIMAVSALLEIPYFAGCIYHNAPETFQWESASLPTFWVFHLLASCGFTLTIIFPCVLWSDMINRKDGKLFFSRYPYDSTKRFFQVCYIIYCLNALANIILIMAFYKIHDPDEFIEGLANSICAFIEPICIFLIACGCLWCGARLQSHVVSTRLESAAVRRVLLFLNLTMWIICISYLVRAVLVLSLVSFMPESYKNNFSIDTPLWLITTRFVPNIFCSLCLMASMRSSGADVAAKNLRDRQAAHSSLFLEKRTSSTNVSSGHLYVPVHFEEDDNRFHGTNLSISESNASGLDEDYPIALGVQSDSPWRPFVQSDELDRDRCYSAGDIYSQMHHAYSPPSSQPVGSVAGSGSSASTWLPPPPADAVAPANSVDFTAGIAFERYEEAPRVMGEEGRG